MPAPDSSSPCNPITARSISIVSAVIWILQQPALIVASMTVLLTVSIAVIGLAVFRRSVSTTRLEKSSSVIGQTFTLVGVLYPLVAAFALTSVWEQYQSAEAAANREAAAIRDLLYESEALPPEIGTDFQQQVQAYAEVVISTEFDRMRHGLPIERGSRDQLRIRRILYSAKPVTRTEIAAYEEAVKSLEELSSSRSERIAASSAKLNVDIWVLLIGGAVICLFFTYMLVCDDFVIHAVTVGLTAALAAFVLYLILTLDRPFVGSLSVSPEPYQNVITSWLRNAPGG